MGKIACLALLAILCSCGGAPTYPIPPQFDRDSLPAPAPDSLMVDMNAVSAPSHFAGDIDSTLQGATWRWTGAKPTVKLLLLRTDGLKYLIDFAAWDKGMRQTGPLTVSFLVNGSVLDTIRYDTPGQKHFEKAVPPEWLNTLTDTAVSASIGPLYVAPEDGKKFGVILIRMGFVHP